jgi:hypothetical protein
MKNTLLALIACAIVFSINQSAQAQSNVMLGLSFMRMDYETAGAGLGNSESTRTILDLKAGYLTASGIYFGAVQDNRTDEVNDSEAERSALGATLGYHNSGWYIHGSYYVSSEIKSGNTTYEKGTGMGFDIGKNFDFVSAVFVGVQLSYKTFSYTEVNGVAQDNEIKSELNPMLSLGLKF